MGIELYWDDDDLTTLLCVFAGRWTWAELYATMKTIQGITEDLQHEVAAIIDIRKGLIFPGGSPLTAQGLAFAKQLLRMGENGTGPVVIVGANAVIRSVYDTMRGIDRRGLANVTFADSVKQAREYLNALTPQQNRVQ